MRIRAGLLIALVGLILVGGAISAVHINDQGIFTANHGQWNDSILFRYDSPDGVMWITASARYYQLFRTDETADRPDPMSPQSLRMRQDSSYRPPVTYTRLVAAKLVGASTDAIACQEGESLYLTHFYLTSDSSKWQTNVPSYAAVTVESVYDGIDCRYYFRDGLLEYDFIVEPGADAGVIRLAYEGVDDMAIDSEGNLELITPWGSIVERAPVAFQEIDGQHREVPVSYVLENDRTVSLEIGAHDNSAELLIDPVLVGTAYIGGAGFESDAMVAVDSNGNVFLMGETKSTDFPHINYHDSIPSAVHLVVVAYDSTLTNIRYVLYFGSSGGVLPGGIRAAPDGSIWAYGTTSSGDLPLMNAFDSIAYGLECWFVHWGSLGDTLLLSSYIGGSGHEYAWNITISAAGILYGVGSTNSYDFLETESQGFGWDDVFWFRLDEQGRQIDRTARVGGSREEYGTDIVVSGDGAVYITGRTFLPDFPVLGSFAYPRIDSTNLDVFVLKVDSAWNTVYSVCFGGKGGDFVNQMTVDKDGCVLVTGVAESGSTYSPGEFPLKNEFQGYTGVAQLAFVSMLNPNGDDFVFSTLLGGRRYQNGVGIGVDSSGYIWVSGSTSSHDFPVVNSIMPWNSSWYMSFLTMFTADGAYVPFSTFFGTGQYTYGTGLAIDAADNVFLCGYGRTMDQREQWFVCG